MTTEKKLSKIFYLLLRGREIEVDGFKYALDDKYRLCTVALDEKGKKHYLNTFFELGAFVNTFNKIKDDTLFILTSENALQEMAEERNAKRNERNTLSSAKNR